jgi:hypothetical protein
MKALIISEDEKVYSTLDEILKKAAYDTIIYKWLLKALDNIEEIRPDLIVVSSSEYPRHWKTLVQFVKSGIGGDNVQIYLYEPTPVSKEDEEKARILGVSGCFSKFDEFEELVKTDDEEVVLRQAQEPQNGVEEPQVEETKPSIPNTGHFMFTHPSSKKFICGKFFDYNGKTLSCSFYKEDDLNSITENMKIYAFSFFDSLKTRTACVQIKNIMKLSPSNIFVIVEIQEIYEEN